MSNRYRVTASTHREGSRIYKEGEFIVTDRDVVSLYANKFLLVEPTRTRNSLMTTTNAPRRICLLEDNNTSLHFVWVPCKNRKDRVSRHRLFDEDPPMGTRARPWAPAPALAGT
jgi:hypothetical protein